MGLHGRDGNSHQRWRRCSAKGTIQLYCCWCSLCDHVPALLKAIHWRNWSKACGSFRGTPAFSGAFQTEPPYQGGGFPVAEHFNLPEHNQVHGMRVSVVRQVKGGMATRQCKERRLIFQQGTLGNLRAQYLLSASTLYHAHA